MTHVKKICLMLGVCISVSSVSPCLAGLHAEAAEMPGIQEIVDANNFVAYCDLYDSIYMDYQSKRDYIVKLLAGVGFKIQFIPQGSFFLFAGLPENCSLSDVCALFYSLLHLV